MINSKSNNNILTVNKIQDLNKQNQLTLTESKTVQKLRSVSSHQSPDNQLVR